MRVARYAVTNDRQQPFPHRRLRRTVSGRGRDTLLRKQPIAGATASSPSRTAGSAAPCQGCSPTHKTRRSLWVGF